jgi:Fe-Mn family superoxide dismutase
MNRREFLRLSVKVGALAILPMAGIGCNGGTGGRKLILPDLPYSEDALEPFISAKTIHYHYGKHHQGYLNKTNKLIAGTRYAGTPLGTIIKQAREKTDNSDIFNNAAQVYNHNFYWNSMKPVGGGEPTGHLAQMMETAFGGYNKFAARFSKTATSHFGSGWTWLVTDGKALKIISTTNADTPIAHGLKPLLTIDLWEHAYYLDYQNARTDYIQKYLKQLVNWNFAADNLG